MQHIEEMDVISNPADEEVSIEFPCLVIENLLIKEQINAFLVDGEKEGVITAPVYGIKGSEWKYIGIIALTSYNIVRMQYLGLRIKCYQDENTSTDFASTESLIGFCTNKALR